MYRIKLAETEEEILEFENLRNKVFHGTKPIVTKMQSPFAQAIEQGDLLAFQCLEEDTLIGGMLIGLTKKNIEIMRLFVEESKREQGVGDFMVKYVDSNKRMFEDYFAVDQIDGCILTPVYGGMDYWTSKGFGFAGQQMYKKYDNRGRK